MLGFTCYNTGFLNVYLMKTKDQSPEVLEQYLKWITWQNRTVRCDPDPVFKGEEFDEVAKSFHVDLIYLAPYTPTQNTMQERRWGIISPPARAMLRTASLPLNYWEFDMLMACYLHNRIYHNGVSGNTVTLANGHTQDISHLRIFACPAYVHIPADQRRKMTDTAF